MAFIVVLGLLIFIGSVLWLIISFFKGKDKKRPLVGMALGFFMVIVSASNMPKTQPENKKQATESSVSKTNMKKNESEHQKLLDEQMEMYKDGSYPYVTGSEVKTNDDGKVDYVQLNITSDWKNFTDDEKQQYIGMLKGISSPFIENDKLPFMQLESGGEIVARSEITNVNRVKILK